MNTVKGCCKTNLDGYTMTVKLFARVPNIGERVSCEKNGMNTSLKVCQITHDMLAGEPFIYVELNK